MLKCILSLAGRFSTPMLNNVTKPVIYNGQNIQGMVQITTRNVSTVLTPNCTSLVDKIINFPLNTQSVRTLTKYSWAKGKRKSVKVVLSRFYRLHWGGWIRTICGRHKKLWKKSAARKRRLRQHVFCNATQSTLLDKMVGPYWKKPKYYVNDPYEPYHTRDEFEFAAKTPRPYIPPEDRIK